MKEWKKAGEEESESGKREVERALVVTLVVFMCVLAVSSCVLDVLVVLVSPSVVIEFGKKILSDTDCEFVEPQSFLSLQEASCALY